MSEHPIGDLMRTTMDNLKQMIDVNTIVGDPVETNEGTLIIPISRVTVGFVSGGSEFKNEEKKDSSNSTDYPFGGGSGAGVSVSPVAFLIVSKGQIKLMPIEYGTPIEKIIDSIPDLLRNVSGVFKGKEESSDEIVVNPT
ncbi:GerW family sporulation protein [Fonticella tunisiensis]|uniref:Sporulation protein YtfJ n=1 Tax=Fonticella tunisiensis TaxID=1096341 RepID=A0A4R7KRA9_9CLOT|nr:GerW family sporulation protein [Fonticella tunisiensis]TDT61912.1 sporulation protein YtfJ [Fonticella tunisiensis]